MFVNNIKELYLYLSKERLDNTYTCIKQNRKSTVLYEFKGYKWVLIPEGLDVILEEDLGLYTKSGGTRVMFINKTDLKEFNHSILCRRLTGSDKNLFDEFHKSCSEADQKEGSVSLVDPVVYGCFVEDKIVSVSSLWNWGDKLSDIGILTHPNFRHKGYGRTVCMKLMSETDKMFVWRCDENNAGSYNLAISIGFTEVGKIYELSLK